MTLVLTTASRLGISAVGDRSFNQRIGQELFVSNDATKVFYSDTLNMSFAIWGDVSTPGKRYDSWFEDLIKGLSPGSSLDDVASIVAKEVNLLLAPMSDDWQALRRGIHVAGYVGDLPCIYHVHTGDQLEPQHELRVYKDYPNLHAASVQAFRQNLDAGKWVQLRNGYHDLHGTIWSEIDSIRQIFEARYGTSLPAFDLRAQLEFDAAVLRFCSGMLAASSKAPEVSQDVKGFAFDHNGLSHSITDTGSRRVWHGPVANRLTIADFGMVAPPTASSGPRIIPSAHDPG